MRQDSPEGRWSTLGQLRREKLRHEGTRTQQLLLRAAASVRRYLLNSHALQDHSCNPFVQLFHTQKAKEKPGASGSQGVGTRISTCPQCASRRGGSSSARLQEHFQDAFLLPNPSCISSSSPHLQPPAPCCPKAGMSHRHAGGAPAGQRVWARLSPSAESPVPVQGQGGDGDTPGRGLCCWVCPGHSIPWLHSRQRAAAPLPRGLFNNPVACTLLAVEAQQRVPATLFCSLEALIKAAGLCARGRDTDEGRDVTASLCTCCHTCLQLGHGRATGTSARVQGQVWGSQGHSSGFRREPDKPASPTTSSCVSCSAPGISPVEQLPRTHWSSEHAALSSIDAHGIHCPARRSPAGDLSISRSILQILSHYTRKCSFSQQHPTQSTCLPWRELIPYKRA